MLHLAPGRSGPREFLNASAAGIFIKTSAPGTSGARMFTNALDTCLSLLGLPCSSWISGGYREGLSVITPGGLSGDVISDKGVSGAKPTK